MADIKLYNTLSRAKETFQPIEPGKAGLYSCGPTVYHDAHIGNLRSNLLSDLVRRLLEWNGYAVTQVINITDVGHLVSDGDEGQDKMEKAAAAGHESAQAMAERYYQAWRSDIEKLHIKTDGTNFPRATDHIAEQIDLVKKLEEKGYTYRASDGIYFDTSKFPAYPELARLDLEGLAEGARVEANPEKKNPADFALWKFSRPDEKRQQEWESPWGTGFPGWHIECSAMSMKYLGNHFDIHTGGIDLVPVHHTNERAQSECATGETFVNYWIHGGFVNIDGEKMSKSLGNAYTLADLEAREISPLAYRYWLLTASYKKTVNFTWEAGKAAETALNKLVSQLAEWKHKYGTGGAVSESYRSQFESFVNDDLDTPKAIALVWELAKDQAVPPADKFATIADFDRFLGFDFQALIDLASASVPGHIKELANERETARKAKDYARSDQLREEIRRQGYVVDDTDEGPKVRKA